MTGFLDFLLVLELEIMNSKMIEEYFQIQLTLSGEEILNLYEEIKILKDLKTTNTSAIILETFMSKYEDLIPDYVP